MKVIKERGLICPFCGSDNVVIRKNASKDFQVYCKKCEAHGGWTTKPQAIINWYSMAINYWKNNGQLTLTKE